MAALDMILKGAPSTVEVGGAPVPLNAGFRQNILAETIDRRDPSSRCDLLLCFYARGGELPREVAINGGEALAAAVAWHDAAWSLVDYGRKRPQRRPRDGERRPRPVFDWNADAAIVASDFLRVYGIDIADADLQMHWYRFMALFLPLLRMPDSLTAQAVTARSPLKGKRTKAEREQHSQQAAAWALPPTELELIEEARRAF